uniref:Uncharacterized protein n=1 Tax=Amphimedon queenslandica TaxID=400682 RepID=A0A1X7V1L5_AMPQE
MLKVFLISALLLLTSQAAKYQRTVKYDNEILIRCPTGVEGMKEFLQLMMLMYGTSLLRAWLTSGLRKTWSRELVLIKKQPRNVLRLLVLKIWYINLKLITQEIKLEMISGLKITMDMMKYMNGIRT